MKVTKEKKQQTKKKVKRIKSSNGALKNKSWEKVKIKGHVITEDGGDFEGLIGLEVLEHYDAALVGKGKLKKGRKEQPVKSKQPVEKKQALEKQQTAQSKQPIEKNELVKKKPPVEKKQPVEQKQQKGKKRKAQTNDEENLSSDGASDMETDSASETEAVSRPKTKKEKLAERTLKKIQKRQERREQRKLMRKQKQKEAQGKAYTENKNPSNQKVETAKKKTKPDRFALLRPPPPESDADSEEEAPELVSEEKSSNALQIDELEGWNGLGVPELVLRALAEKGFKSPTEIQTMTLPAAIMGKKDILGAAETGSGKTLAFGIPLIAGILELKAKQARSGIRKAPKVKKVKQKFEKKGKSGKGGDAESEEEEDGEKANDDANDDDRELTPPPEELAFFPKLTAGDDDAEFSDNSLDEAEEFRRNGPLYAVVLTPTRELAVQVKEHLVVAAKYTGIKVAAIFGGLSVAKQERVLRQCPEIVVATPGRFWELYEQENPHLSKIDDISFLVIDETDRMVEKGHFEELRLLLKVINADETKKQTRQNFVFSATLTLVHDLPEHMQRRNTGKRPKFVKPTAEVKIQSLIDELGISQPKIVDLTRSQQTAQTLTECRLICPIDHKDYYLYYFVQRHPGRTIVFCNSIDCVKRLATLFGLLNCNPLPLHANMIQKQRLKNLERFRDSSDGLLIATDVAARGLDIPNVEHVIHYQVPRTSENYVHRSGRTARANRDGITVMFMEPGEVKSYVRLYRTLERSEDLPLFPVSERYLSAVKERVNLAREVDKQELKLRRNQAEAGWMKKHADEMEIIIDGYNDESGSDQDEDPFIIEKRRDRVHLANVRTELRSFLAKEIFPKGFSVKYPTSTGQLQMPGMAASANDPSASAVKVMQDAIKDMKLAKKMRNKKKKHN